MSSLLSLRNIVVGYKDSAPVASAIDAELSVGEFCCLLGRNGSGKSTLLRTVAGIQGALGGEMVRPERVAIVLTQTPELQHTTVREMVAYGRLGTTGWLGRLHDEDYMAADKAIEMVGIRSLSGRLFHTLSDGERQKTMIARAIAQEAPLLLLDEPSAFLDYPSRRELMRLLQELTHLHGKGVLLSTHDVELAAEWADRLWIVKDGKMNCIKPEEWSTFEF